MRHLLLALGVIAVITGCSQATAQELFGVESLGEKCLVLTCFYECQAAPGPTTFTFWNELTTLQLANISDRPIDVAVTFFDGQAHPVATTSFSLQKEKHANLHACETVA